MAVVRSQVEAALKKRSTQEAAAADTKAALASARKPAVVHRLVSLLAAAARLTALTSAWSLVNAQPADPIRLLGAALLYSLSAVSLAAVNPQAAWSNKHILAPVLGIEISWLVMSAHAAAAVNAAATLGMGVGLYQLVGAAVKPSLDHVIARAGDRVDVHIRARLRDMSTHFYSSHDSHPLELSVGHSYSTTSSASAAGQPAGTHGTAAAGGSDSSTLHQKGVAGGAGAGGRSGEAVALDETNDQELADLVNDIVSLQLQQAPKDLDSRWSSFLPALSDALQGMYVGETRQVTCFNPRVGGYFDPSFCWWQPKEDVLKKFGGRTPECGDVFFYPVRDDCWLQAQVSTVGERFVEVDANYGVAGQDVVLDVQLVKLIKGSPGTLHR